MIYHGEEERNSTFIGAMGLQFPDVNVQIDVDDDGEMIGALLTLPDFQLSEARPPL